MASGISGLGVYIAPELDLLSPEKRQWFEQLGDAVGRKFYSLAEIPDDAPVIVGPTKGTLQFIAWRRTRWTPTFYWDRGYFSRFPGDMRRAMHRIVVNETQKTFVSKHFGPRTELPDLREKSAGKTVLILAHSSTAERYHGLSGWTESVLKRVEASTSRPVRVRSKGDTSSLAADLADCHCVVTGISNAAVEAAILGKPAICAPESAAWPLCPNKFTEIENPFMDERKWWLESLSWGQFTFAEMLRVKPFETVLGDHERRR